jgi:hypothetical protein
VLAGDELRQAGVENGRVEQRFLHGISQKNPARQGATAPGYTRL